MTSESTELNISLNRIRVPDPGRLEIPRNSNAPSTTQRDAAIELKSVQLAQNGSANRPTPPQPLTDIVERSTWERRYARNLLITDTAVVIGAVALALYIRFGGPPDPRYALHVVPAYSLLVAAIWLTLLIAIRARSRRCIGSGVDEYRRVATATFWTFGAIAIFELLLKLDLSRGFLAVAFPVGLSGLLLSRLLWRRHVSRKRADRHYQTAIMAIGDRASVLQLAKELVDNPGLGYEVVGVGIYGYGPPRGEALAVNDQMIPILGGETHALHAISDCGADTVAIAGTGHFDAKELRRLLWELEPTGVDLLVSPGFLDVALSRLNMRPIGGLPMLHVEKPQYRGTKRFQKRAFDSCFALLVLMVMSPVFLVVAAAIKCTSRGPVFYASERIGIDGNPFMMLKFRTMVDGADKQVSRLLADNESDGVLFKIRQDPRVTPIGRILRRFSIDELPQFINVVRQEMSVVGPRPPLRREVDAYDDDVLRRLLVKPGITGLWQVSGRSDLSWDRTVRLDLSYVDNWSMLVDILIIAKTLRAVISHEGAY